ncbi:TPA: hypothetical protein ACT9AU_001900 [Legionella pneumophila]|uniref:hypothetical protein n=1 Tax=Legionella pneumophila TaxID=446 RepID=UPI001A243923|nr:hypothetical protein [Legionella pneumophila]HAU0941423.1 hypothetical protein [Legionella pneumophila]HAU1183366.1 hypothetical protein [Legionella pneumophila]HBD7468643.1 hypothetical protein [Legionella pneumophila]HDO7873634.1 hypothetical protein [Legionella pneumophila]
MSFSSEILLSKPEIYILISIMTNQSESGQSVLKSIISDNLKSVNDNDFLNFIDFKLNLNVERLIANNLIERANYVSEPAYSLTSAGTKWLLDNEHRLQELLSASSDPNLIGS